MLSHAIDTLLSLASYVLEDLVRCADYTHRDEDDDDGAGKCINQLHFHYRSNRFAALY